MVRLQTRGSQGKQDLPARPQMVLRASGAIVSLVWLISKKLRAKRRERNSQEGESEAVGATVARCAATRRCPPSRSCFKSTWPSQRCRPKQHSPKSELQRLRAVGPQFIKRATQPQMSRFSILRATRKSSFTPTKVTLFNRMKHYLVSKDLASMHLKSSSPRPLEL